VNQARQAKHFHIVLDNLSAQKTKAVEEVLEHLNGSVAAHAPDCIQNCDCR